MRCSAHFTIVGSKEVFSRISEVTNSVFSLDTVNLLDVVEGVNLTAGLPIIRTSPDHGVAFEIAWQNKAQARSMKAAIELAVQMACLRMEN